MNATMLAAPDLDAAADLALQAAARLWYGVAVIGATLFALAATAVTLQAATGIDVDAWSRFMAGTDPAGRGLASSMLAATALAAAIVCGSVGLQLLPRMRAASPRFQRCNAAALPALASAAAVVTLALAAARVDGQDAVQLAPQVLGAILVLVFAEKARGAALAGDRLDQRIALLRVALVAGAPWLARAGFMLWVLVNQGPVGFDPGSVEGPAIALFGFGGVLVPLVILDAYLFAQASATRPARLGMAVALLAFTALAGGGIVAAALGVWLPLA